MRFVWEASKAARNLAKHATTFEEASTVFLDSLSITGADPDHSADEERWLTFGVSTHGNLLVVSHTDEGEAVRIISARPASRPERRLYEEG